MAQSQYGTIDDLRTLSITRAAADRFGPTAMTACLQAASGIADSYLPSQFTLPLTAWDASLTLQVCNIAAWLLYNQFGFSPMAPGDELVVKRYDAALDWLKQVRDKLIFPQYADSSGTTPELEAGPYIISDPPVGFTDRGVTNGGMVGSWPWGWT